MKNKLLLALASIIFCLILIEIFLRAGIALGVAGLADPNLYADPLADDDYWKLRLLWTDFREAPTEGIDPDLGWAPPKTAANPLGLTSDAVYEPDYDGRVILFYGDSFVAGLTAPGDAIPQQLDARLSDYTVYNYGVPGYGVDQTYLRIRATSHEFNHPVVLFGLLTFDLDRTILNVRSGPKPRLAFSATGDMRVLNVPITHTAEEWLADHPPHIDSYLFAFLARTRAMLQAAGAGHEFGVEARTAEKQTLNAAIMRHAAGYAGARDLPLRFVIFYTRSEMHLPSWREEFLRTQCARLDAAACIDTKPLLLDAAARRGVDVADFYQPDGRHLNETGNAVVAEAVAQEIQAWLVSDTALTQSER